MSQLDRILNRVTLAYKNKALKSTQFLWGGECWGKDKSLGSSAITDDIFEWQHSVALAASKSLSASSQ